MIGPLQQQVGLEYGAVDGEGEPRPPAVLLPALGPRHGAATNLPAEARHLLASHREQLGGIGPVAGEITVHVVVAAEQIPD